MNDSPQLSHLDEHGRASMVDVSRKPYTERVAIANGEVHMSPSTLELITSRNLKKGDIFTAAQLAGVMAAKRTADLVPLCHSLDLTHIAVELSTKENLGGGSCGVMITSTVRTTSKTGVEMEALTAVSVAALTVYDMAKSVDKTMRISNIRLIEKRGGVSGDIINE